MPFAVLRRLSEQRYSSVFIIALAAAIWGLIAWRNVQDLPVQRHIEAGQALFQKGHTIDAEEQWKQAVRLDPNNARAWELLGDLQLGAGSYKVALEDFERVFRLQPDTPALRARMAIAAYQVEKKSVARGFAESQLKTEPDNVMALEVLMNVERDAGDHDAVLRHLQRLVELQPQSTRVLIALCEELSSRGEYDKTVVLADRLVKLQPDSASAYFRRGLAIYSANPDAESLARAQTDFQKVLELNPNDVEAHRYLGRVAMRRNNPKLAIEEFEAVGRNRPFASAHLMELSAAYSRAGNAPHANKLRERYTHLKQINARWLDAQESLNSSPKDGKAFLQLGNLLLHSTELDEPTFQLYRYQIQKKKLKSVKHYISEAKRMLAKDVSVEVSLRELENAYKRRLKLLLQAIKNEDIRGVKSQLEHVDALNPNDPRTFAILKKNEANLLRISSYSLAKE